MLTLPEHIKANGVKPSRSKMTVSDADALAMNRFQDEEDLSTYYSKTFRYWKVFRLMQSGHLATYGNCRGVSEATRLHQKRSA